MTCSRRPILTTIDERQPRSAGGATSGHHDRRRDSRGERRALAHGGPRRTDTADAPGSASSERAGASAPATPAERVGPPEGIHPDVAKPKEHTGVMPPMGGAQLSASGVSALAAYLVALNQRAER